MNKPHPHKDLIIAWANGATIQSWDCGYWYDVKSPNWGSGEQYRIKPEPKPDVVKYAVYDASENKVDPLLYACAQIGDDEDDWTNIRLTFDGETGELKKAEVVE